ncbi:protein kinase domain-containing protein [Sulfurisphaera tokodaii]|uniref:Protein kinase domain-containing protein n=2 Tax=Sulfurisphaera tokodaii TaxID=111955 RepID=Q96Z36_SULTO|nr:protein kinase [Sulfurisphaera tokodaii]BAB67090.1 putative protein kinase [Sulfurisphaera tokodaii str. 7]HII73398.1 protein kinase [Sulfurisphaera tokodaii]
MSSCSYLINMGVSLYNSGKLKEAYEKFNEALNLCPNDENALLWKGKAEVMMGKLDEAIKTLKSMNSGEAQYYLSLALYLYSFFVKEQQKTLQEALFYATRAVRNSSNNEVTKLSYLLEVMILAEIGRVKEAWQILQNEYIYYNLGYAYIRLKQGYADDAIFSSGLIQADFTLKGLDKGFIKDLALVIKGRALIEEKKYGEAVFELQHVNINVLRLLALLYEAQAYEKMGLQDAECLTYSEIVQTLDTPLIREKMSKCTISSLSTLNPPSVLLSKPLLSLSSWNPKIWVNRKLHGYLVKEVIGEGGNGYVLKATGSDGKDYAIKVLKIGTGSGSDEYFKNLVNEAYPLVSISNNPNVVRIYAIYADELIIKNIISGNTSLYLQDPPMIVMELMNGGTLLDLLSDDKFYYSIYWRKTVYRAIASVAEALVEIHSNGFVHCDIKPQNVFLTFKPKDPADLPNINFKLGDLGGAVKVGSSVVQLTTEYAPLEAFTDKAKPSFDVFSLGITLYVLLTGVIYRPDSREMEDAFNCYKVNDMNCVTRNVTIAKQKLALWDPNVPAEVKPLLKRMIDPDPLKRPTAKEVLDQITRLK